MTHALSFDELMHAVRGFQESRVLLTALELDLFAAVAEGADAPAVAARLRTDPRATAMLLNALTAMGALEKRGDAYHCTEGSARLAQARPGLLHTVHLWDTWSTLTEAVRQGTTVVPPGVEAHRPAWTEAFIAAMHARARVEAEGLVRVIGTLGLQRMLDVGGGSGAFSLAFAQAIPDLHAEILDLGPVVTLARRYIQDAGLADRVIAREGDLRQDALGEGYDLILVSAICHMLDEAENQDLLCRCAAALKPGGQVVIRDFILDPDRAGPRQPALFALNMLVGTRRGNSYTEADYRGWLCEAGFDCVVRPVPGGDIIVGFRLR